MKLRHLTLLLCVSLSLTGCSALLERNYATVEPHSSKFWESEAAGTLRAENYQDIVNDLLILIGQHTESATVRLYNYEDDLTVADTLEQATTEVQQETPMGAYAVEYITASSRSQRGYYEISIQISYRRTAEQVASVNTVAGSGAIRGELRDALTSFVPETAFRVNYFDQAQGDDYIPRLIRQAYYDSPAAALGLPEAVVNLYPESGQQRAVEVLFTYPEEPELLREKSQALTSAAQVLVDPYRTGLRNSALIPVLYRALREHTGLGEAQDAPLPAPSVSGSTAYAALVEGQADSEGLALTFQLLSGKMEVGSVLVEGTLNGEPHFWNQLTADGGAHYVDLTRDASGTTYSAADLLSLGYVWEGAEENAENLN